MRADCAAGLPQEQLLENCLAELAREGITPEAIIGSIPPELRRMLPAEAPEVLPRLLTLTLAAMVAASAENKTALLPFDMTSHCFVTSESGVPLVWGIASPLDPQRAIEQFAVKCYQTFPAESFSHSRNAARNAEWFMRHKQDHDSYREIALSDPRAGLAPEVRVSPSEYPEEVQRATDRVAKAVQRFCRGWTKKAAMMSKEEAD